MTKKIGSYCITTPKIASSSGELKQDCHIQKTIELLDKYNIKWHTCDTMAGWYNLNQEWIETETDFEINVEYSNALPTNWSEEDKNFFNDMIYEGNIIVLVWWIKRNGEEIEYIRNN